MKFGLSTYAPMVVYIACIIVFLAMCFYKREIGLYFIVALLPLERLMEKLDQFPLGKDIVDIYVITLLALCLLRPATSEEKDYGSLIPTKPILLYVLLTYIYLWLGSLQLGIDLPISWGDSRSMNWKNHMILPVLFLITLKTVRDKRQIILFSSIVLVSIFLLDFHFYRNFEHTGGHFKWDKRDTGMFAHLGPNEIAAFWAEYSFIIIGILFLCEQNFWKWSLLALLSLNMYCLLYSFSRGGYLAFLAAFLFISLVHRNIKALALLVLFLVFWTSLVPQSVVERIEMTEGEEGGLDSSSQGRLLRWEHGMSLFLKNPLGYGFETAGYLHFPRSGFGGDPHNRYMEFLVEMGIPGILLFLYLFFLAFRSGWKLYVASEDKFLKGLGLGFAATVVACIVSNFFGVRWTYVELGAFYWIFWALVVRGNLLVQTSKDKSQEIAPLSIKQ